MANLIKKIKIKQQDGSFTDYIPIGAEAGNVNVDDESVATKLNKTPYYYNTVANMKADTKLKAGDMAITLGYYEANDGGKAEYKITNTSSQNEYQENLENGLYATLIVNDYVTPEMIGAYGDGEHDDTDKIQYLINKYDTVKLNRKTYIAKGIQVSSYKKIIGDDTILSGDNTTDGIKMYDSENSNIRNVNISGVKLIYYKVGLFGINVRHSLFTKVICQGCETGANFAGSTFVNRFYECEFTDCTNDGFKVGLEITHPLLGLQVLPNSATFDFHSCIFLNNIGYGLNGWCRLFNFFGGYSESNSLAGLRMIGTETYQNQGNSFFGFDIEEEKIGIYFDGLEDSSRVSYFKYDGGQMNLEYDENQICSSFYFNGTCTPSYNYNIYINSKFSGGNVNIYDIYVSGSSKSIQAEFNTGNNNFAIIKTNLTSCIPNGMIKNTDLSLPLSIFSNDYYDGTNVVIPAGKSIEITIPTLKFVNSLSITTTSSASFMLDVYGMRINQYGRIGAGGATSTDNVTSWNINGTCNNLKITNRRTNAITITDIKITGMFKN